MEQEPREGDGGKKNRLAMTERGAREKSLICLMTGGQLMEMKLLEVEPRKWRTRVTPEAWRAEAELQACGSEVETGA